MKQLFSLLILIALTFTLAAQEQKPSYILKSGVVYKLLNKDSDLWSEPLKIDTLLHSGDYIKSDGPFTLVIPTNLRNLTSKKCYTFNSCKGAQIPEDLRKSYGKFEESKEIYTLEKCEVVIQGEEDLTSKTNVKLIIYNPKTGNEVTDGDSISLASGINLAIINQEKESVFTYLLWKDKEWNSYVKKGYDCIKISPYSAYDESVALFEPLGSQLVVMICYKGQVPKPADYFVKLLNAKPHIIDSLVCRKFNLVK